MRCRHEKSSVVWLWCRYGVPGLWTKVGTCAAAIDREAALDLSLGTRREGTIGHLEPFDSPLTSAPCYYYCGSYPRPSILPLFWAVHPSISHRTFRRNVCWEGNFPAASVKPRLTLPRGEGANVMHKSVGHTRSMLQGAFIRFEPHPTLGCFYFLVFLLYNF